MTDAGRERWVDADGLWIHTVEWLPDRAPGRGAPLLLVHGLGGSTLNWELVAPALAARLDVAVRAVDLVGFGRTRAHGRAASMATNGTLLATLLDQIGPSIVVGNSMGGSLGVGLAARRADLVRGLVLVDPALPRPTRNREQLARTARFAAMTVPRLGAPIVAARARALGPARLVDSTLGVVFARSQRLDPELRQRMIALAAERLSYPEAASAYTQAAGSLFRYLANGMRADVDAVRPPTLVIHGDQDRLVPVSFARALELARPDWSLVVLADCGHAPQMEQPADFVETVVTWASRRDGGGPAAPSQA